METFWEKDGWEADDRHLKKIQAMPFQRPFPFIPKKPGLYIIRGPRQVGKSSWLKTVLSNYAKKTPCFYLSCENVSDHKELAEILKSVRHQKVVLLDEVNFVEHWDRAVKHEVDSGHTFILMITGSHAYDLRRGADQMPGRFDHGGEFHLLPMDFEESVTMRKQAGWNQENRLEALKTYFRVGGFPAAVAESGKNGRRPTKSMDTYLRWLIGDSIKLGKQESYMKELLIQLALTLQTPISLQTLAKKTNIGSHNTVQEYVSILESCFALRTLYAVDPDRQGYHYKKDKKFYFSDPLIYWIALDLAGTREPGNIEDRLAELVANEALCRRYKRFGYFKTQKGEVDFLSPKNWALEVKWSNIPLNLSAAYKQLVLGEKIVWTYHNFLSEYPRGG
jgi:predicted AAA+ superfamily ATPase